MIVAGIAHWTPVIVVSLLAVPLAILAAVALVRLRVHRGEAPGRARLRSWTEVLMVAGTVPWVWMILTPLAVRMRFARSRLSTFLSCSRAGR